MRAIGKIAALAMTLSLAVVLSACGGNASSSASASASASTASVASSSASASAESASASSANASATTTSTSASAASTSATALSEATSYTNDAFGIEYDLPEGWSFMDAKKLGETNQVISNMASSDEVDMIAASADGTTSVIVAIAGSTPETAGKSAQEFLNGQVQELEAGLKGTFEYETTEAEITFNGMTRTLPAAFTTMKVGDATIVLGQAVAEKDGHFLDVIAAGTNVADVENAFKAFRATSE